MPRISNGLVGKEPLLSEQRNNLENHENKPTGNNI